MHIIHFKYTTTGKKDSVSFHIHPEFMDAYNSLKNYCSEFIEVLYCTHIK